VVPVTKVTGDLLLPFLSDRCSSVARGRGAPVLVRVYLVLRYLGP
jgi:hypothetical protein